MIQTCPVAEGFGFKVASEYQTGKQTNDVPIHVTSKYIQCAI
jgi:hypothetical protein